MRLDEISKGITEAWSEKYKRSINCSHPKGFSQRAHCQGKKKHNESVEMEMVCPDCGMCESHGNLTEIKKGQKDSNGYTRCWPGKHAEGTKKGKNGGRVRNCVPNESIDHEVDEAAPAALRTAVGAGLGAASAVGAGIFASLFGPLPAVAAGLTSAVAGYEVGTGAADKIWDWVSGKLGGERPAEEFADAHIQAAQRGELSFEFNGKHYPVKLKPNQVQQAAQAVKQVSEAKNPRQQSAIAIAMKAAHKKPKNEATELSKPDHEGGMAISQLKGIADKANELVSMMNQDQQLEAWVQSLITRAETDITDVHDYLKHSSEPSEPDVYESAPKGWEGTVKAMKKHKDEIDNPWALAHWMKNKGYKSHKK